MPKKKSTKAASEGEQPNSPTQAEPEPDSQELAPGDQSDPGYEDLYREIDREAKFTSDESALNRRVKKFVRENGRLFVEVGALLDGQLFRGAPESGDESKRMAHAVHSLVRLMPQMCELDLDELKRDARLRRAAGIALVHWLMSDPDAAEVEQPPSMLAKAPWDGAGFGVRTHLRDSVFRGMPRDEEMETAPNPLRARWVLVVRSAMDELAEVGSSSPSPVSAQTAEPSLTRAKQEFADYDRPPALTPNEKKIARILVALGEGQGVDRKTLINLHGIPEGSFGRAMDVLKQSWGVVSSKGGGYHLRSTRDVERLRRAIDS